MSSQGVLNSTNPDTTAESNSNPDNNNSTNTTTDSALDDVWASSDDESNFIPKVKESYGEDDGDENTPDHVDIIALRRKHGKQGYLDGLSQAKEESLQEGFDSGYPKGATLGFLSGTLLMDLKSLLNENKLSSSDFETAKSELDITNILQQKYFNDDLNLIEKRHPVLVKWENYINNI
ncbi:unnamed protein product [[Candida] boidinii]|nr:hypothetical protein BVG19_g818 [[Candida] boidinii]OWB50830.1 hypothetical protein B5S27_g2383 [[Candida] boidinii]GMF55231.1 unnamed protein product [[Candida] boidinii]